MIDKAILQSLNEVKDEKDLKNRVKLMVNKNKLANSTVLMIKNGLLRRLSEKPFEVCLIQMCFPEVIDYKNVYRCMIEIYKEKLEGV